MNIQHSNGQSEYGPGVEINLTSEEIAIAIHAYLVSHNINIIGPRTINVNGILCKYGQIYVDPSGIVERDARIWYGSGNSQNLREL